MYTPSAKMANPRKDIVRWWNEAIKRLLKQIESPNIVIINENKISSLFLDAIFSILIY